MSEEQGKSHELTEVESDPQCYICGRPRSEHELIEGQLEWGEDWFHHVFEAKGEGWK